MTYPVLTLRGEIVQRIAQALFNAWPISFLRPSFRTFEDLAEAALSELESRGLITFEEPK